MTSRVVRTGIAGLVVAALALMLGACGTTETTADRNYYPDRSYQTEWGETLSAAEKDAYTEQAYGAPRTETTYREPQYQARAAEPLAGAHRGQLGNLRTIEGEPTVVADVQTGKTVPVILGPESQVRNLNLEQGQYVSIDGNLVTRDGQQWLMARDVNKITAEQASAFRPGQFGQSIQGRVSDVREIAGQRFVVADLQTGEKLTVNLGPRNQIQALELSPGDQIRVSGNLTTHEGQQMLMADRLFFHDQTITINRTGAPTIAEPGTYGVERRMGEQPAKAAPLGMAAGQTVDIKLHAADLDMDESIKPGLVTLRIHNDTDMVKSFRLEGANLSQPVLVTLDPNQTHTLQVNLPEGDYKAFVSGKDLTQWGKSFEIEVED